MILHIRVNNGITPDKLIKIITDCIEHGMDLNDTKIQTWAASIVTQKINGQKYIGFKNTTQFENNGWVKLTAQYNSIKAEFRQKLNGDETSDEQVAIVLFRFASMLRNHFGQCVQSITLTDI